MIALGALFFVSGVACGEEKTWEDQAEFTFVDTSGNSLVTTLSAKNLLIVRLSATLQGSCKFAALYGSSDGERNAEAYSGEVRVDSSFGERAYGFVSGGWSRDRFAGIDDRGWGGGYRFLRGPRHTLVGESGLTYSRENLSGGEQRDFVGGRIFGDYILNFAEKNRFSQSIEWLPDFKETVAFEQRDGPDIICQQHLFPQNQLHRSLPQPPATRPNIDRLHSRHRAGDQSMTSVA